MRRDHILEYWEHGEGPAPTTALIITLLDRNENLLWLTRFSSAANSSTYFWIGIASLAIAGIFSIAAPWGQSLVEYCGQNSLYSCRKLYYSLYAGVLVITPISTYFFWLARRAKRSPWVIAYAISTKRAIVLDERDPRDIREVDLDSYSARPGPSGQVRFGPTNKPKAISANLRPRAAERAVYWATVGRQLPQSQVRDTP